MSKSNWETLSQCRKISRICVLFKAYSGERAWKVIGDRLQRSNYLSRIDHDWKIRNRRQRTDIGKYSFVNRTIRLWNRLPAEILGTLPCKPSAFRKRLRRVIDPSNVKLNPICSLLALLGAHHILHINRIRVNVVN
jgi:hypothetical protein